MNCPYCGAGNPTGGKFCRRCGKPLAILKAEKPAEKAEDSEEKAKAFSSEEAPPQPDLEPPIVTAENGGHQDTICPYCGGTDCTPVSRTVGKASGSGYSIGNGCCGMCLLGPFGLLCGLCGRGTKLDLKNETAWVCRACGKEHLSQKDALEKAEAMVFSLGSEAALIALALSFAIYLFDWSWICGAIWALSPLVIYYLVLSEIESELGYPLKEILPSTSTITLALILGEAVILLLLFLGEPIISYCLGGLLA